MVTKKKKRWGGSYPFVGRAHPFGIVSPIYFVFIVFSFLAMALVLTRENVEPLVLIRGSSVQSRMVVLVTTSASRPYEFFLAMGGPGCDYFVGVPSSETNPNEFKR